MKFPSPFSLSSCLVRREVNSPVYNDTKKPEKAFTRILGVVSFFTFVFSHLFAMNITFTSFSYTVSSFGLGMLCEFVLLIKKREKERKKSNNKNEILLIGGKVICCFLVLLR